MVKKRGKKKMGATRVAPTRASNGLWGLGGLSIGCCIALFVYLDKLPPTIEKTSVALEKKNVPKVAEKSEKVKNKEQAFGFYSILPEREMKVDHAIDNTNATKKTNNDSPYQNDHSQDEKPQYKKPIVTPTAIVKKSSVPTSIPKIKINKEKPVTAPVSLSLYQLQVGAFTELIKADALKARLALTGIVSNIQVIRSNEKKIYRLRVGPSTDVKNLEQIKQRLKRQNINSFLHKLKNT